MMQITYDNLNQLRDFSFVGKSEQTQIADAEQALGLKFSTDYTAVIARYGAISFRGHHFTGISPFPGNDVVRVTKEQREYNPHISGDLYVIEEALIDGIVIWQDCQGRVYLSRPNQDPVLVSNSLVEYINQLMIDVTV